jgi:hypothetical protein
MLCRIQGKRINLKNKLDRVEAVRAEPVEAWAASTPSPIWLAFQNPATLRQAQANGILEYSTDFSRMERRKPRLIEIISS